MKVEARFSLKKKCFGFSELFELPRNPILKIQGWLNPSARDLKSVCAMCSKTSTFQILRHRSVPDESVHMLYVKRTTASTRYTNPRNTSFSNVSEL